MDILLIIVSIYGGGPKLVAVYDDMGKCEQAIVQSKGEGVRMACVATSDAKQTMWR